MGYGEGHNDTEPRSGRSDVKPDKSLIPDPDRSVVARKPLTPKQRAMIALRQGGYCGCGCGVKLDHSGEGTIDEHLNPLGLTGTNDLDNREIWRKPCSALKTAGDLANIAASKRKAGETGQWARRQKRGGGSIKSRGFPKGGPKKPWPKRPFGR